MSASQKSRTMLVIIAVLALATSISMGIFYQRDLKTNIGSNFDSEDTDSNLVLDDPYTFSTVNELCSRPDVKIEEKEATLTFNEPAPNDDRKTNCAWGVGDNLTPRPGKLASRYEQVVVTQMPQKTVLCGLEITANNKPFSRQDYFLLLLNGRILATDAEFLFQYLKEEKVKLSDIENISSYTYDWSRILGMRIPKDQINGPKREYCIGRDISLANCHFKNGENPSLELNDKISRWLGSKNSGPNLKFSLVVTGDNDPKGDCTHTPLTFKIKIKYVSAI